MRVWSEWIEAKAWRRVLLVLICIMPLAAGVMSRLSEGSTWFRDFDAVACAGSRLAAGLTIYDAFPACEGMKPTGYVYLPWVAQAFEAASAVLGYNGFKLVYGAVYLLAFGLLAWAAFLKRDAVGGVWDRILAMGLVTGSTLYWGNIAVVLHALVVGAALVATRRPILFACVLAAAATVKPIFLTYGIVLLVLPIPLWKRLGLGALAAGLGLAPTVHFMLTGGALVDQWNANLEFYVYGRQPGDGFLGWLDVVGFDAGSTAAQAGWAVFAAVVVVAAVTLAERGGLSPQQRVWLGMGAGALANPRIVPLDVFMLAMMLGAAIHVARLAGLQEQERRWAVGLCIGAALVGALGNSLDAGDYAPKVFTLGVTGVMIWMAAVVARRPVSLQALPA